jgi:hypothetical protein
VKKDRRNPLRGWRRRRSAAGADRRRLAPALSIVFIILLAAPIANDSPNVMTIKAQLAQQLIDELRTALSIPAQVQIAIVIHDPFVFSVQPIDKTRSRFTLSMELGFLLELKDDELRAAVAHELGHVWIYTHHPYLQTERLANTIGLRVVDRSSFEKVYSKLWVYEGKPGVPIDQLLGPPARD